MPEPAGHGSEIRKPLSRASPRLVNRVPHLALPRVGSDASPLVCSEPKKRPEGRRRYFACKDVKVTARQIMLGYRLHWAVELFHKKMGIRLTRDTSYPQLLILRV
jgi:hypothetical protein